MVVGGNCKIGVLGGIGPEATGEFYNKLIKRLQERKLIRRNRDFPQVVINSIPAPELIYDRVLDEELRPYIEGLKELDKFGVDFIVMVCNTIHLYYDRLQEHVGTPVIDLRAELKNLLYRKKIRSVLVIGTPNTIKQGLYRFDNIRYFEPNKRETKELIGTIFNFNKGIEKRKQVRKVKRICQKYLSRGAEIVILGCTEFAVMLDEEDLPKINTIDVLVDAIIERISTTR